MVGETVCIHNKDTKEHCFFCCDIKDCNTCKSFLDKVAESMPQHHKKCRQIIVGGLRSACPEKRRREKGPHSKWICHKDCKFKKIDAR